MQCATTRRDFIKSIGLSGVMVSGMGALSACATKARTPRRDGMPNIVYILADDMGYGDLSCLNPDSKIPTPNMDRLAEGGVIFTDAHSPSAVCTPTRYGVLTGRYPWRSRLKQGVLFGYSEHLMEPERMTVASMLKASGYHTACIGKWHLGMDWARKPGSGTAEPGPESIDFTKPIANAPCTVGFDSFYGVSASLDMPPYVYIEDDRCVAPPTTQLEGVLSQPKGFYRPGPAQEGFDVADVLPEITRRAVGYIDGRAVSAGREPFFLYFPLTAPHTPIAPTEEFRGKSKAGEYGDFVCQVDWTVGEVMSALERNGMAENTLIIVTSDNGCSPNADFKELDSMGHHPSYRFRGHKADIFEGGHRIPFVARWPKAIPAGTVSDETMCLTDLMATVAGIVGVELPDNAGEDSYCMLPAMTGKNPATPIREATVQASVNGSLSIRQGQWKLELCPGSGGWSYPKPPEAKKLGLPPVQLYDLANDIGETTNVQDKHPEVVKRLADLLQSYVDNGRSTPGAPQKNEGETSIWGPGK